MENKVVGVIKTWIANRNYGFISVKDAEGNETKYFLHRNRIISGNPAYGMEVSFLVSRIQEGEHLSAIKAEIGEKIVGGSL